MLTSCISQADGEDVVEDQFVDAGQQGVELVRALDAAVGVGDGDVAQVFQGVVDAGEALDFELAAQRVHAQQAAGLAAVERRHVAPSTLGREPVQHRPHELHQRRFSGFVRAVEHRDVVRQPLDLQSGPTPNPFIFTSEILTMKLLRTSCQL